MTCFISKCWAVTLCVVGTLVLGGCTGVSPYRHYLVEEPTQEARFYWPSDARCEKLIFLDNNPQDPCFTASVERTDKYTLFFIEFDEQGRYYDRRQLNALMNYLARIEANKEFQATRDKVVDCPKQLKQNNGISIVTFVHGWRNNARYDNDNVQLARDTLNFTYGGEAAGSHFNPSNCPREVVGVYVGWRGASTSVSDIPHTGLASWVGLWELISVWDRKNTAQNVAVGSVRELFSLLKGYQDGRNASDKAVCNGGAKFNDLYLCMPVRHLIVGHSYGALIVNNAVTQQLLENVSTGRFTKADKDPCDATPDSRGNSRGRALVRPYADLIVLLNPAVEGARYEPLQEAVAARARETQGEEGAFCPNQKPVMVILTSEKDVPTGQLFRAVRWASTLVESSSPYNEKYSENQRRYIGREEALSSVRTMGHNERYHTHELMGHEEFDIRFGAGVPDQQASTDPVDARSQAARQAYAQSFKNGCDAKAGLKGMKSGLRDWRCKTKEWEGQEKMTEKERSCYASLADINLSQMLRSNSGGDRTPGWSATFLGGSTITHIPDYPGSRGMDEKGAQLYTLNSPYSPIWNVYVKDKSIMDGHSDIRFPRLLAVLQQLYHSVVLKSYAPEVLKAFGDAAEDEYNAKCVQSTEVRPVEAE